MIAIDLERREVRVEGPEGVAVHPFGTREAFAIVSRAWLQCGWDAKYVYTFSWLGRPVIQLPDDLLRIQEVVHALRPDVIVETGVAHGGSLVFHATLCKALGRGRVVGIENALRPENRRAIETHELAPWITLVDGDSTDPAVAARVRGLVREGETVLLVLDASHRRAHVLAELRAYADLVSVGSYAVAADGIMKDLVGAPRSRPEWKDDNPWRAAQDFLAERPDFRLDPPRRPFDESVGIDDGVTYWPGAWLKRIR